MTAKKRVIGIAILTAIAIIGDSMMLIVLPIYWQDFGLTALWQVGVLLSINRFIRLPINPLVGLFYQRFQLRTGLFIAIFLAVISTFSYGMFQSFWILFVMRALWGVSWSLLRLGGYLTIIEVSSEKDRGSFVGTYNGLWGLGGLVGMLAGGFLIDQTSLFFVTALFAGIGLFGFPMVFMVVPSIPVQKVVTTPTPSRTWNLGFSSYIWMILMTGFVMGFIVFGLFATTLSSLIDRIYINEWVFQDAVIGAATIAGVIQAVRWAWDPFLAPVVGKKLDSVSTKANLLYVPLFGGFLLFILFVSTNLILLLLLFLLSFQVLSTIFVTTVDTLATSAAIGPCSIKVITAHTIVIDVGAAMGPLLSFVLIQYFGLNAVYWLASILLLLLGSAWLGYTHKTKNA